VGRSETSFQGYYYYYFFFFSHRHSHHFSLTDFGKYITVPSTFQAHLTCCSHHIFTNWATSPHALSLWEDGCYFGSSQIGNELLLLVFGEPFAGAHRLDQLALQLPDHSLWPLASGGLACELCACTVVVVAEVVAPEHDRPRVNPRIRLKV